MPHSHHHDHGESNLAVVFFLNLCFTIIEFAGGIYTNSIAVQSDALHDLGDTISIGLAWYFQKLSKRGRTKKFTFGFRRFNTLGALITGVILAAGSVYIISETVSRFFHPEESNAQGMIWLAILGVAVNGYAAIRASHGHTLNERMISWHLIEDVLGWLAVLIGSVVMLYTGIWWIDPLLSLLITTYILINVALNLRKVIKIMLQAVPDGYSVRDVRQKIETIAGVEEAHHLHLWTLDGEFHLLSAHIVVKDDFSFDQMRKMKKRICDILEEDLQIEHVTLEFEHRGQCIDPD